MPFEKPNYNNEHDSRMYDEGKEAAEKAIAAKEYTLVELWGSWIRCQDGEKPRHPYDDGYLSALDAAWEALWN